MTMNIRHPFLEAPLNQAMNFYNQYVVPRLTKKNKVIAISTAIVLSVYFIVDKVLRPPKNLRHIPYESYWSFFKSLFSGESFIEKTERVRLPILNAPENNGIYMTPQAGIWVVHVCNPIDAKYVLMKPDKYPKIKFVRDDGESQNLFAKFVGNNIATTNGAHWKSQRMVANPAFHRSMPVKLFGRLTLKLFGIVEETDGQNVNISDLVRRWTLDAIGNAGFGFDFKAITEKDNEWVKTYNAIDKGLQDPFFFVLPILDTKLLWLSPKRQAVHREVERFTAMIDQIIIKKREAIATGTNQNDALEENEKDLLTLMIEAQAKGEGIMSNKELKSNIAAFFLAGNDTTSNTLAFAFYHLAVNPEIQERAREEVLEILGDQPEDVIPTVEQTKRMVYLNQVIKEVLRVNGPTAQVLPRLTAEDTTLSGTFIPKNTFLTVDIYNLHRSEKIWKDSSRFDPDRFADNGEAENKGEGSSWMPFGNGPRQCIAMNFSLAEQRVLLSMKLKRYKWTLAENSLHKDKLHIKGMAILSPETLEIKLEKRH